MNNRTRSILRWWRVVLIPWLLLWLGWKFREVASEVDQAIEDGADWARADWGEG